MYKQALKQVNNCALAKLKLFDSKGKYLVASILAGVYVGFAILLIFTISGNLVDSATKSVVMGMSFGVALSLVIMCGSELFTGNNFVLTIGGLSNKLSCGQIVNMWAICYIGNLIGALIISFIFILAGLGGESATGSALASAGIAKASVAPVGLIARGFLCNVLVCLAVFCSIKMESEIGKLVMIWWCLFVFITSSYEHSIANMTIYLTSILGHTGVTISQMAYNLVFVTIGNMLGAVALAISYYYLGKQ